MADGFDYEKFFTLSIDMLCVADTDHKFKRVNPAFTRVLGWTEQELLANPYTDFVHPDDLGATSDEAESLRHGLPTVSFRNRYRCRDGTYRGLLWTAFKDKPSGLIYAVAHDLGPCGD